MRNVCPSVKGCYVGKMPAVSRQRNQLVNVRKASLGIHSREVNVSLTSAPSQIHVKIPKFVSEVDVRNVVRTSSVELGRPVIKIRINVNVSRSMSGIRT